MNKQDLIIDFIDGKIDPESKDILFEHLYYDEAAREEFTQQIQILLKINQVFKPLPVPTNVTNNVYSALGIKQNTLINTLQNLIRSRYGKYGLVVALFFLLTFSSFYIGQLYNQNKLNSFAKLNHSYSNNVPMVSSVELDANLNSLSRKNELANNNLLYNHNHLLQLANYSILVNFIDSYYRNHYANLLNNKFVYASPNQLIKSNENKTNQSQLLSNEDLSSNQLAPLSFSKTNATVTTNLLPNFTNSAQYNRVKPNGTINELIGSLLPKDYRYEVCLSNMITQTASLNGLKTPGINQFDFNARYYLNSNNAIGINIGYENFPQEFIRTIQGKEFTQIQSPDLIYLGISYKYNYFQSPIGDLLIPYFGLTIGGTQVGPIIKGQLGANLPIWDIIAINLGINNSFLIYNVENKLYSTNKLNFVYGLNIKL